MLIATPLRALDSAIPTLCGRGSYPFSFPGVRTASVEKADNDEKNLEHCKR